jgi:hypothetical protein
MPDKLLPMLLHSIITYIYTCNCFHSFPISAFASFNTKCCPCSRALLVFDIILWLHSHDHDQPSKSRSTSSREARLASKLLLICESMIYLQYSILIYSCIARASTYWYWYTGLGVNRNTRFPIGSEYGDAPYLATNKFADMSCIIYTPSVKCVT